MTCICYVSLQCIAKYILSFLLNRISFLLLEMKMLIWSLLILVCLTSLDQVPFEYSPWCKIYIRTSVSRYQLVYACSFSKEKHSDLPEFLCFHWMEHCTMYTWLWNWVRIYRFNDGYPVKVNLFFFWRSRLICLSFFGVIRFLEFSD